MPWMISGSARRPARSSAGSALGRTLKTMKVMPLTTHSSSRVHSSLRMMYVPMRCAVILRRAGPARKGGAGCAVSRVSSTYLIEVNEKSNAL